MRLHRFYLEPKEVGLRHYLQVSDKRLLEQWLRVLRYRQGQQVIIFDGHSSDHLYVITKLNKTAAELELITRLKSVVPSKNLYLFWSLLKKDKNDWVLQKCTELGLNHFVPIMAERSEKTGFDYQRARKIVVEAAEQCGRGNIPSITEPVLLQSAIHEYAAMIPLLAAEQEGSLRQKTFDYKDAGILIGPEGGWSEAEKQIFSTQEVGRLHLGKFTLRAETAAVAASIKLLQ